jgi:hypothetical protein
MKVDMSDPNLDSELVRKIYHVVFLSNIMAVIHTKYLILEVYNNKIYTDPVYTSQKTAFPLQGQTG